MDKKLEELLQICEQEKLHLSGAIQPFGALITVDKKSGLITHASANLADFIGADPKEILGQNIQMLALDIERHLKPDKTIGSNEYHYNFLEHNKKTIDMLISVGENSFVVEFEPRATGVNQTLPQNHPVVRSNLLQ